MISAGYGYSTINFGSTKDYHCFHDFTPQRAPIVVYALQLDICIYNFFDNDR